MKIGYIDVFLTKSIVFSCFVSTEIQAAGGIISAEDITSYVPLRLDPLSVTFMGGSTYVGKYIKVIFLSYR